MGVWLRTAFDQSGVTQPFLEGLNKGWHFVCSFTVTLQTLSRHRNSTAGMTLKRNSYLPFSTEIRETVAHKGPTTVSLFLSFLYYWGFFSYLAPSDSSHEYSHLSYLCVSICFILMCSTCVCLPLEDIVSVTLFFFVRLLQVLCVTCLPFKHTGCFYSSILVNSQLNKFLQFEKSKLT